MTTLGLPPAMFWIFVATVLAGSLGAIHFVVVHMIMGRPFAEIPPPVMREGGGLPAPGGGGGGPGTGGEGADGRPAPGSRAPGDAGSQDGADDGPARGRGDG